MSNNAIRDFRSTASIASSLHNQVPPKVDYRLTTRGQCPALDALLKWAEVRAGLKTLDVKEPS
jgi:DNA-binding HxlR family transcriptional regulator